MFKSNREESLEYKEEISRLNVVVKGLNSKVELLMEQINFLDNHKTRHLNNYKIMRDDYFKIINNITNIFSDPEILDALKNAKENE